MVEQLDYRNSIHLPDTNGHLVTWSSGTIGQPQHIALNDYKGVRRELNRTTASDQIAPSPYKI